MMDDSSCPVGGHGWTGYIVRICESILKADEILEILRKLQDMLNTCLPPM